MISVLFNLLRLVLWTRTWSVLVNVLCMLAESKYSTTLELVLNVYFNLLVGGGVSPLSLARRSRVCVGVISDTTLKGDTNRKFRNKLILTEI